jgi:hypothetical protein
MAEGNFELEEEELSVVGCSMFDLRCPLSVVQCSMFDVRISSSNVRCSMFILPSSTDSLFIRPTRRTASQEASENIEKQGLIISPSATSSATPLQAARSMSQVMAHPIAPTSTPLI